MGSGVEDEPTRAVICEYTNIVLFYGFGNTFTTTQFRGLVEQGDGAAEGGKLENNIFALGVWAPRAIVGQ